ncbi:FmdB family zinc ribbon protein [Desulfosalsimonas propionicica]|uniref:FmdB family zinc ribbon protein n=1 Tax=Desulfosalsimonas propionicica TaxID=332175 RepID=UPI0015EBD490
MPIYEYECESCGRVHEILQKVSENPLTQCPDCSGMLHKRISQCTFHLKGTGWYATDYAKGTSASSSSSGKKDDSSTKEASADAQPKNSSSASDD